MAAMVGPVEQQVLRRTVLLAWPLSLPAGLLSACENLPGALELTSGILESRRLTIRAGGRLVHTGPNKQQRVFQISVLRKRLGQNTNMLWSVLDPPAARLRILVEVSPGGRTTVWRVSPTKASAVALSLNSRAEAILGTHLTIEDLVEDCFYWPKQKVTGTEILGDKTCYVLRSEHDESRASAYAAVQSWIDRTSLIPLRMLKSPIGSGPRKEVLCRGLRRSGGQWVASRVEFRVPGTPGSTRIIFTEGSGNARVRDNEVDPKVLLAPRAENH